MNRLINIGIIGDYDGRPSHLATDEALKHCASKLGHEIEITWMSTDLMERDNGNLLIGFDGLWCAPGSPYKSMKGAINGIRFAREKDIPFLGTCGGFQHAVMEYGRNVLNIQELYNENFNPYEPNSFITALSCNLVGQSRHILLNKESKLNRIYGTEEIVERYNCSFGLNKEFQNQLERHGFLVVGEDEEGEARIMILPEKKFFVATLFQPQLSSTSEHPHPLIIEYLSSCHILE